jgi:hypothetical protein
VLYAHFGDVLSGAANPKHFIVVFRILIPEFLG